MCGIHGDAFDGSWAGSDRNDDLFQPDRPLHSTTASGSVAIWESSVHHFNNCLVFMFQEYVYGMAMQVVHMMLVY